MKSPFIFVMWTIALLFGVLALIAFLFTSLGSIIGLQLLAVPVFFLVLDYIHSKIQKIQFKKLTSDNLIKFNIYLALIGVFSTVFIIGLFHLNPSESAGVATVGAEALGFIGLSLVELTIFLAVKRPKTGTSLNFL